MNTWFPVDCTHGSDHNADTNNGAPANNSTNPYYFAIPPEQLIYTHKPKCDDWQLLQVPLSLESFKDKITISHKYFELGKLSLILYIANRSRWKTFAVFADRLVLQNFSSETACGIGLAMQDYHLTANVSSKLKFSSETMKLFYLE